jgi:hypothetical protein
MSNDKDLQEQYDRLEMEKAKTNTRLDVSLRAMGIHAVWTEGSFKILRVYNGWIYTNIGSGEQTFVPEYYNVNADCRTGN